MRLALEEGGSRNLPDVLVHDVRRRRTGSEHGRRDLVCVSDAGACERGYRPSWGILGQDLRLERPRCGSSLVSITATALEQSTHLAECGLGLG